MKRNYKKIAIGALALLIIIVVGRYVVLCVSSIYMSYSVISSGVKAQDSTSEGQMFTDFKAEYDGKVQRLSDYVGKGNYVLVDFWASWCTPCRAEIPNLINAYDKYKDKNFVVLGVASWDKPEDTLKAIEGMNIPYPQIINAQSYGTDAYGILGIPQIILFGPDGTILRRSLRGQGIESALSEYLQ